MAVTLSLALRFPNSDIRAKPTGATPIEAIARRRSPAASPIANRGSACRGNARGGAARRSSTGCKGGNPLAKRLSVGKGSRHLRRADNAAQ
ncbi:hypothetical protein GW17_00055377 [Ensete ventricosum]|nr:hypothetical protein GW17_00055377 [Ensete ventricosum]